MTKRKPSASTYIDGNNEGDIIQGKGNTLDKSTYNINSGTDPDELSDAIYNANYRSRWEQHRAEAFESESRKIIETAFISIVSAIAIGLFWEYTFLWSVETIPFLIILITFFFNLIRLVHFGLRQSIMVWFVLSAVYILLVEYVINLDTWISTNQFVGIAKLGMLGAFIGLMTGVILLFWKPLGD